MKRTPRGTVTRNSLARDEAAAFVSQNRLRRTPHKPPGSSAGWNTDGWSTDTSATSFVSAESDSGVTDTEDPTPRAYPNTCPSKKPRIFSPAFRFRLKSPITTTPTPVPRNRPPKQNPFLVTSTTPKNTPPRMPSNSKAPARDNQMPGAFVSSAPGIPSDPSSRVQQDDNHFSSRVFREFLEEFEMKRREETATLLAAMNSMQNQIDVLQGAKLSSEGTVPGTTPEPSSQNVPETRQYTPIRDSSKVFLRGGDRWDRYVPPRPDPRDAGPPPNGAPPPHPPPRSDRRDNDLSDRGRDLPQGDRYRGYANDRSDNGLNDRQSEKLRSKDLGDFTGEKVEYFIRSLEMMSSLYGERAVCGNIPRCMKGAAREWITSMSIFELRRLQTVDDWIMVLRENFGDSTRRLREVAEERFFDPDKETSDKYCFDKMGLHKQANPSIPQEELLLELWKGLEKKAPECKVMGWTQRSTRDFRDELRQRADDMKKSRKYTYRRSQGSYKNYPKQDQDKERSRPYAQQKPSDKGLGSCICGGDHFRRDCPQYIKKESEKNDKKSSDRKKKTYVSVPVENSGSDSPPL